MQHIGVIVNHATPRAPQALRQVAATAARLGLTLHADEATCRLAGGGISTVATVEAFQNLVEAVVVLGGDGTLLHAAHTLEASGLPLMGFNIGSLGYLASVDAAHFDEALAALRDGSHQISERTTLSARIIRADGTSSTIGLKALNDVVVTRGASARLVHLGLGLNDSMSPPAPAMASSWPRPRIHGLLAGGRRPILLPETPALTICVICPHALGARPLVVPVASTITLCCKESPGQQLLALDGRECGILEQGDLVEITRSPVVVRIASLVESNPLAVLNRKLGGALEGRLRHHTGGECCQP